MFFHFCFQKKRGKEWMAFLYKNRSRIYCQLEQIRPCTHCMIMCQLKSLCSSACRCGFMWYYVNVRMCKSVCVCPSVNVWIIHSRPTSSREETVHFIICCVYKWVCVRTFMCNNAEWVLSVDHFFSATGRPCDICTVTEVRKKPISTCHSSKARGSRGAARSLNPLCWYLCKTCLWKRGDQSVSEWKRYYCCIL